MRVKGGTAEGRERRNPQGGPLPVGIWGGVPCWGPHSPAKSGCSRQWSLLDDREQFLPPHLPSACGRRKAEGDRQRLCLRDLSPISTSTLQVLQEEAGATGNGERPGLGIRKLCFRPCCAV